MKKLAVLLVTLASMIVGCSLAADVTPPPAEQIGMTAETIAMTMVAATVEVDGGVASALQETQSATDALPPTVTNAPTLTDTSTAAPAVTPAKVETRPTTSVDMMLSLIHISEPTRRYAIADAVVCV